MLRDPDGDGYHDLENEVTSASARAEPQVHQDRMSEGPRRGNTQAAGQSRRQMVTLGQSDLVPTNSHHR